MKRPFFIALVFCLCASVYASTNDPLAMEKFLNGLSQQSKGLKTMSCVVKTLDRMGPLSEKADTTAPRDTSFSNFYLVFPDTSRVEMLNSGSKFVVIMQGKYSYKLNNKTGKAELVDSTQMPSGSMVMDSKNLLKMFVKKPTFKVLHKDSIAQMQGVFKMQGLVGNATLECDLKQNLVCGVVVQFDSSKVEFKIDYEKMQGRYFQKKTVMVSTRGDNVRTITTICDDVILNGAIDRKLFKLQDNVEVKK